MSDKYLIVGLGNPGRKYANTRHNVGWWVLEELVKRHNLTNPRTERKAITYDGVINGRRVLLAAPQTYMNLSGEAVRALMDYYKVAIDQIIIIHDDLDIPLGTLRLRKTGSHGGQNGVRNIIQHLGTKDFARVRFGIGRPPGKMRAVDYVLTGFQGDDAILAEQVKETAADAIEAWLKDGLDIAMTRYNGDINDAGNDQQEKSKPEDEISLAERAHELAPDDPKPLEKLARLYKKVKRYDDAIQAHLTLADVYDRLEKAGAMIANMERAVAIRPHLTDVQEQIARAYEATDDNKRAASTWLKLAQYHIEQGNHDTAQQAVSEALRINPQHPLAQSLQQELNDAPQQSTE